jgi:hypothetical protein
MKLTFLLMQLYYNINQWHSKKLMHLWTIILNLQICDQWKEKKKKTFMKHINNKKVIKSTKLIFLKKRIIK